MGAKETGGPGEAAEVTLQKAAVRAAARWVRKYGIDGTTFERSVQRVLVDVYEYSRVLYVYEARRILLHTRPTKGETELHAIPDPEALDPWKGDHEGLEARTRVAAKCPRCTNGVRSRCGKCNATHSAPCRPCDGTGRVPGVRGSKNCPECRGVGSKRCRDCKGAGLVCELCEGSSQLSVWLALERAPRSEVAVGPPAMFMHPHPDVHLVNDFDAGRRPNPLREDSGLVAPEEVELPADLAPAHRPNERLIGARLQRFGWKSFTVEAETVFGVSRIRVENDATTVSTLRSDPSAFQNRLFAMGGVGFLGLILPFALETLYGRRHPFFAMYGHGSSVFWLAVVLSVGALASVGVASLVPRARPKRLLPSAAGSAFASAVGVALVFFLSRPTAAHALESLSKGNVAAASLETDALRVWKKDIDGARQVTDELQLRSAADATSVAELGAIAKKDWRSNEKRDQVVARLRGAVQREALAAEERKAGGELEAIARWCDGADDGLARKYHAQAATFEVERCVSSSDIACMVAQLGRARSFGADAVRVEKLETDARGVIGTKLSEHWRIVLDPAAQPKARLAAVEAALLLSKHWADLRGGASSPSRTEIEQMKVRLPGIIAEAQAKAERERQAREAADAARERATRVRCGDGSYSPSCRCGGSLQGCCSRHGGVVGCGER